MVSGVGSFVKDTSLEKITSQRLRLTKEISEHKASEAVNMSTSDTSGDEPKLAEFNFQANLPLPTRLELTGNLAGNWKDSEIVEEL